MLKIAVFDSGYGGENFADRLEEELPIINVIRVIDWRHAEEIQSSAKNARRCAEEALRPYIGKVDLIIFANYLLSSTSLKYFSHKYKQQKFLGLQLEQPCLFVKKDVLIMTTKALTKTIYYHQFVHHLKLPNKTITLDSWPAKIDDGELSFDEIKETIKLYTANKDFHPSEVIIGCSQFSDIIPELKKVFGASTKFCDGSRDVLSSIYKALHLRGGSGRKARLYA